MPWLLVGELRRIIKRPEDAPGPKYQVQILAEETLKSGEIREQILTLGTDDPRPFEAYIGQSVALEASPWAKKDGSLGVSMPAKPVVRPAPSLPPPLT